MHQALKISMNLLNKNKKFMQLMIISNYILFKYLTRKISNVNFVPHDIWLIN